MLICSIKQGTTKAETSGVFLFKYLSRPISKVEIVGIVMSLQTSFKKSIYHVDDGTGVIRCIKYMNDEKINTNFALQLGDLVSVKGTLCLAETNYEDYGFCINIATIEYANDPNMELFHWLSSLTLHECEYQNKST
jgi:aspartyl/asparaginyl-tRNA synthetase